MKLILNSIFLFLFIFSLPGYSKNIYKTYTIKVSGIKIGKLNWEIKINNQIYHNKLKLNSEGLLSALYKFKGEYFVQGSVENALLKPKKYTHVWHTNRVKKNMTLSFEDNKLKSLKQTPIEKEVLRIDVFKIENVKDPLTSFLEIIMGKDSSLVLDGRRLYTMNAVGNKNKGSKTIELSNYFNLWADHKRSKFEKIIFEKKNDSVLPSIILIYFDERVFTLKED